MAIQYLAMAGAFMHSQYGFQGQKPSVRFFTKSFPVSSVLFRPKEIHSASAVRKVPSPIFGWYVYIKENVFGIGPFDRSVANCDGQIFSTIKARKINTD